MVHQNINTNNSRDKNKSNGHRVLATVLASFLLLLILGGYDCNYEYQDDGSSGRDSGIDSLVDHRRRHREDITKEHGVYTRLRRRRYGILVDRVSSAISRLPWRKQVGVSSNARGHSLKNIDGNVNRSTAGLSRDGINYPATSKNRSVDNESQHGKREQSHQEVVEEPPRRTTDHTMSDILDSERMIIQKLLLELGSHDYDDINELLEDLVISLPGLRLDLQVDLMNGALRNVALVLRNMECKDIYLWHVEAEENTLELEYTVQNNQVLAATLQIHDFDFVCQFDYDYRYERIVRMRGSGHGQLETLKNSLKASMTFSPVVGTTFQQEPPTRVSVTGCLARIQIDDMDFRGDWLSQLLNIAEPLLRDMVEEEMNAFVCQYMQEEGVTIIARLLQTTATRLDEYEALGNNDDGDVLEMEQNLVVPSNVHLVNFQDETTKAILEEGTAVLGSSMDDPNSPTGQDLGINVYMRDFLLDDNRTLQLDRADSGYVFHLDNEGGELPLSISASFQLERITVYGLDTITRLDPVEVLGKYTLSTHVAWETLMVEADVRLGIAFEENDLVMIERKDGSTASIMESLSIALGTLTKLEADATLMVALDSDKIGNLQLGSLLYTNQLVPCIVSTIYKSGMAALDVQLDNIVNGPIVSTNIISPGLDQILATSVDMFSIVYKPTLLRALPGIMAKTGSDIANELLQQYLDDPSHEVNCQLKVSSRQLFNTGPFLDYRDLLLPPDLAVVAGASGLEPYGNVICNVMNLLETRLLISSTDNGSLLRINSVLVRPLTKAQSGVEGTLRLTSLANVTLPPIEIFEGFVDTIRLEAVDLTFENLDTLEDPVQLMQCESVDSHVITNLVHLEGPIRASTRLFLSVAGKDSEVPAVLNMRNDFRLSLTTGPSMHLWLRMLAKIQTKDFLVFPLKDILEPYCWLAAIPCPEMDKEGIPVFMDEIYAAIADFFVSLDNITIDFQCHSCTTSGLLEIPHVLEIIRDTGLMEQIMSRLESFIMQVLTSDWMQIEVDRFLHEAPMRCPHSKFYNEGFEGDHYDPLGFPPLSKSSVELFVLAGSAAVQSAAVVVSETHNAQNYIPVARGSNEQKKYELDLTEPPRGMYLNLTELIDTRGWIAKAIRDLQHYLGHTVENANPPGLGVNDLIRSLLLVDPGEPFHIALKYPIALNAGNTSVALKELRLFGLDTVGSSIQVLDIIGAYTFGNLFEWEQLRMEVDVVIHVPSEAQLSKDRVLMNEIDPATLMLALQLKNLTVDAPLMAVIDEESLLDESLESLFNEESFLPCIPASFHVLKIPHLFVQVDSIHVPKVSGFLSAELESIVSNTMDATFEYYGTRIVEAIPSIFDVSIRRVINKYLLLNRETNNHSECIAPEPSETALVDFRDLLLPPPVAKVRGGSGTLPYTWLVPFGKELIDGMFTTVNSVTGLARMNEILIHPLSMWLSGEEGKFSFSEALLNINISGLSFAGLEGVQFQVSNTSLKNVNTVAASLLLLEPVSTSGQWLNNSISLGSNQRPLQGSFRFLLSAKGDPVLTMRNELEVSIAFQLSILEALTFAEMHHLDLVRLSLRNMLDFNCWLAAMKMPRLDSDGLRLLGTMPTLGLQHLRLALRVSELNVRCVSCTTSALHILSDVIATLKEVPSMAILQTSLVELASELIMSDFAQTLVDRMLVGASERCEKQTTSIQSTSPNTYNLPPFPSLSRERLEDASFLAVVLVEMMTVVVAEGHSAEVTENKNPVSAESALQVPNNVHLINWVSIESAARSIWADTIESWFDLKFDDLNSFLHDEVNTPEASKARKDIRINELLRSIVLDEDGIAAINFRNWSVEQLNVNITTARIRGLDTLRSLNLFQVLGNETIRSSFSLERLSMEVDITVNTPNTTAPFVAFNSSRSLQGEPITFSIGFQDINASLAILLAIDQEKLGGTHLGPLLHRNKIFSCILPCIFAINVTQLQVAVGAFDFPTFNGFRSIAVEATLREITDILLGKYEHLILSAIPAMLNDTVRIFVNKWLVSLLKSIDTGTCNAPETNGSRFIDFRDLLVTGAEARSLGGLGSDPYGDILSMLNERLRNNLLAFEVTSGLAAINDMVVGPLTRVQSGVTGTVRLPGELVGIGRYWRAHDFNPRIDVRVYDAVIENVDTLGAPLSPFEAVLDMPNQINTTATIGVGRPLRALVKVIISIDDKAQCRWINEFEVSVDLKAANLLATMLVRIATDHFLQFPLRDVSNLNCWLATLPRPSLDEYGTRVIGTMPGADLTRFELGISEVRLNITCIKCNNPFLEDFPASLPDSVPSFTNGVNDVLAFAAQFLVGKISDLQIGRAVFRAAERCPHRPEYTHNASSAKYEAFQLPHRTAEGMDGLVTFGIVASCVCLLLLATWVAMKLRFNKANRTLILSLSKEELNVLHQQQKTMKDFEQALNRLSKPLIKTRVIPLSIRIAIPLIILGNIAFFLSGHLSLGGAITIRGQVAGQSISVPDFFEMSILMTTFDLWNAGGKIVAVIVMVLTVIWPYVKQSLSLALWVLPPTIVPVSRRGTIYMWLDALSKWSMLDIFMLLIAIAGFDVSVVPPNLAFLPEDFYEIHFHFLPLWGLYANMIAQLISQLSSHVIIHYHRRTVEVARKEFAEERKSNHSLENGGSSRGIKKAIVDREGKTTILHHHQFILSHTNGVRTRVRRCFISLLVFYGICLAFFVGLGATLPAIRMETLGLIGLAAESGNEFENDSTAYSLFDLISVLFHEAKFFGSRRSWIGLTSLSIVLIWSMLMVPFLLILTNLSEWFLQLSNTARNRLFVFKEALRAWQYLEVFLVSLLLATWQFAKISELVLKDACEEFEHIFATLTYYGVIQERDSLCLRVDFFLENACYVLFATAVLLGILNLCVSEAVWQCASDLRLAPFPNPSIEDTGCADVAPARDILIAKLKFTDLFSIFLRKADTSISPSNEQREQQQTT